MPDWKERLEEFLAVADPEASRLDAEGRAAAAQQLQEAFVSGEAEAFLLEVEQRFPARAPGGSLLPRRAYLRGRLLLELGRPAEALEILLPLCEKIEQQKQWSELGAIAAEILDAIASLEAARYLAKSVEEGGPSMAPEGCLARALEAFPDEHRLCWLVAEDLERAGEDERALGLFIGCLPALVDTRNHVRLEEVFIRCEELSDPETVATLLQACIRMTAVKEWKLAETYLEPLLPRIRKAGLVHETWEHLVRLLPKAPADSNLRRIMVAIAPDALPGVDGVLDLLARSGLLDPKIKPTTALNRLTQLLEFAPGYRVLHHNWGAGRVRAHEGDALIIDFPGRPGHRMSLAIARSALTVIPPDDLRVLWTEQPDRVRDLVREKPAEVAYLAIRELGGRTTAQDLRRRLTAEIVPVARWSVWWKEARVAMEVDERFDLSESFRQTYAIRTPHAASDEDLLLPRLDRRRGIRANLNLLRRFLDQHATYQDRAVKMYGPSLVRWLRDESTQPEAALAICLLLDRWGRLDPEDLERSLRAVMTRGVEASAYADLGDQRFLVGNALKIEGLEREAILFALGSRYPEIREMALVRLREDPVRGERILTDLLGRPEERPQTALGLILLMIAEGAVPEEFHPSPWRAAASLCRLVERTGRDILRNQLMRLFTPRSSLAEALRREPPTEEDEIALSEVLTRWRESERFLFPILEFFEAAGLTAVVQAARAERTAATNRLFVLQHQGDAAFAALYMSRASYERMESERAQLRHELNHVLPDIIRHARELGDLSENAEYHAAKEKQGRHTQRVAEIDRLLSRITLIENVRVPDGQIGPGSWTETRVVSGPATGGERRVFWVLGEGDSRFGQEVVSCNAPLGRALLGHKVGDRVSLELAEGVVEVEVLSAQQRLPQGAPAGQ